MSDKAIIFDENHDGYEPESIVQVDKIKQGGYYLSSSGAIICKPDIYGHGSQMPAAKLRKLPPTDRRVLEHRLGKELWQALDLDRIGEGEIHGIMRACERPVGAYAIALDNSQMVDGDLWLDNADPVVAFTPVSKPKPATDRDVLEVLLSMCVEGCDEHNIITSHLAQNPTPTE